MIRKLLVTTFVAVIVVASCSCGAVEMRGAWMGAWWPGYFTAKEIDASVAAAKKAGINAFFIQVRKNADAYYKSDIEPRGSGIAPGFDPLAYAIDRCHANGIQVHAWVNAFRVGSSKPSTDPNNVVNRHPDWINKTIDGKIMGTEGVYLDPGVPAARDYIAKIIIDIATRYDVDGIQWDYVRYPGVNFGYSDTALAYYFSDSGTATRPEPKDPKWQQWKRDQVTKLARSVYKHLHAIKPNIWVSASTITWGRCPSDFTMGDAYATVCQDWKSWMSEGILDANLPMCYKVESSASGAQSFRGWLEGFKRWNGGRPTWVGIDVDNNSDAGVIAQIEAIRKAGLEGFVLYKFNQIPRRNSLVEALAANCKTAPAPVKVPAPTKAPKPAAESGPGTPKLAPSLVVK